uniref:RNA-directed DNA polymerase, eukaryota, reverse transcriptase zinc-binding domain protein n=1 Tax=Tanacetum cinerariifolium TaxID=118510 RepID=A0A699H6F8_TANCI|nr:RNA-directed DNA polymerase, eukaryota, reverse transcriptase zinc-binding domain protein [Tanacetum cinerariifolium]
MVWISDTFDTPMVDRTKLDEDLHGKIVDPIRYCDVDHTGCQDIRRSTFGSDQFLGDKLFGCRLSPFKKSGLLHKWKWRFLTEENSLWRIVIKDFYGIHGGFGSSVNSNAIGDTMFWKDSWFRDGTRLMDKFPRLYALESDKDCLVRDRWCSVNRVWGSRWSWCFAPRGRANEDLSSLVSLIRNLSLLKEGLDKWIWSKDSSSRIKNRDRRIESGSYDPTN